VVELLAQPLELRAGPDLDERLGLEVAEGRVLPPRAAREHGAVRVDVDVVPREVARPVVVLLRPHLEQELAVLAVEVLVKRE